MVGKPFSIQAPEEIAKKYGGNKQRIAQAVQTGLLDPTSAVLAGMFIDRMRGAQAEEARPVQTVAQQVMAPPALMAPPGVGGPGMAPPAGGFGALAPGMAAGGYARGDLTNLPIPDTMFDEPSNGGFDDGYAGGGIVAFADGGGADDIPPALQTGQEVPLFGPGTTLEGIGRHVKNYRTDVLAYSMQSNAKNARTAAERNNARVRLFGGGKILPVPEVRDMDFYRNAASKAIAAQNAPAPAATPAPSSPLAGTLAGKYAVPNLPSAAAAAPDVSAPPRAPVADAGIGALRAAQNAPAPAGGLGAAAPGATDMGSQLTNYYKQVGDFMGSTEAPEMKAYKEYLAGVPAQMEKQREQDKWMALAQLGASLASSKSPYFLQALGEAGTKAIPAIAEASKERQKTEREAMLAQAKMALEQQGLRGAQLDRALQLTYIASQRAIQQQQLGLEERKLGIELRKIASQTGIERERLDLLRDKVGINPNAAYLEAAKLARSLDPATAAEGKKQLEAVTQLIKLLHPSGSNAMTDAQAVAAAIQGTGGAGASSGDVAFSELQ